LVVTHIQYHMDPDNIDLIEVPGHLPTVPFQASGHCDPSFIPLHGTQYVIKTPGIKDPMDFDIKLESFRDFVHNRSNCSNFIHIHTNRSGQAIGEGADIGSIGQVEFKSVPTGLKTLLVKKIDDKNWKEFSGNGKIWLSRDDGEEYPGYRDLEKDVRNLEKFKLIGLMKRFI
jgi:hypothetical protein